MEAIVVLVFALVIVALLVVIARRFMPPRRLELKGSAPDEVVKRDRQGRIVLDLVAPDPKAPAIQRLAHDAARRALASARSDEILVVDREGTQLAVVRPDDPLPAGVDLPPELHEPHAKRSRTPTPVGRQGSTPLSREGPPEPGDVSVPGRPFADRFDLPSIVHEHLEDPDHPADVIRAILAAAGRSAERHGELVLADDVAIVVADVSDGADAALTRAYLRVQEADRPHGIVVRLGYADPTLVRRRDAAAPNVRHAGTNAVQRMADALAVGADPVAFATEPLVSSVRS